MYALGLEQTGSGGAPQIVQADNIFSDISASDTRQMLGTEQKKPTAAETTTVATTTAAATAIKCSQNSASSLWLFQHDLL